MKAAWGRRKREEGSNRGFDGDEDEDCDGGQRDAAGSAGLRGDPKLIPLKKLSRRKMEERDRMRMREGNSNIRVVRANHMISPHFCSGSC